jgi:hypothetical protein
MKTAEEILSKHIDKESMDGLSENVWSDMLEAMEEYAKQFKQSDIDKEELMKLSLKIDEALTSKNKESLKRRLRESRNPYDLNQAPGFRKKKNYG